MRSGHPHRWRADDQGRTRVTRDEEVFLCESGEISGTVGDDPRGVDARAREVAPPSALTCPGGPAGSVDLEGR